MFFKIKTYLNILNFRISNQINLYFRDLSIFPLVKSELYGEIDLIANFGGILGLFLGISFISIFEIVFHCLVNSIVKYIDKKLIIRSNPIILDIDEPFYIKNGKTIYIKGKKHG